MDPRVTKDARRQTWLGVLAGVLVAGIAAILIGALAIAGDPSSEPPPRRDLREVDAGLEEGCALLVDDHARTRVPLHARPGVDELIVEELAVGERLEVVSARRDFVEVRRGGQTVWIERRYTRRVCD